MHNQGSAQTISNAPHDVAPATEIKEVEIKSYVVDESLSKTVPVNERLTVLSTIKSITEGAIKTIGKRHDIPLPPNRDLSVEVAHFPNGTSSTSPLTSG